MKRLTLLLALVMAFGMIYGQRNNRTSAFNDLRNGRLDRAQEFIDKTIEHPQTKEDARSWFYRGNIYLSIFMSEDEEYRALSDNALGVALESYIKAKEYDTRNQYFTDIITNLLVLSEQFYNLGVEQYNDGELLKALSSFEQSLLSSEMLDVIDTMVVFNIAITAEIAGENEVAKKRYTDLIEMEFESPDIFTGMGRILMAEGDTATALNYLTSGRERFPEDFTLLINEINIYLLSGNVQEAVDQLEMAIEKDDSNPTIFFAVGVAYDQLRASQPEQADEFFNKARNAYERATELNPAYFDAFYNLGALYVNNAAVLIEEANRIPFPYPNRDEEKRYNELIERANEYLRSAMPKLERALELEPEDFNTMVSLKEIYTRLNKLEQLKDIDARILEYQQRN